jgi:hypothetical protein
MKTCPVLATPTHLYPSVPRLFVSLRHLSLSTDTHFQTRNFETYVYSIISRVDLFHVMFFSLAIYFSLYVSFVLWEVRR